MFIACQDSARRTAWARIGLVRFSNTGRTLYYDGRVLSRPGQGWYTDTATGELFHIATARRDGLDRSEGRKRGSFPVQIDDEVREQYWAQIRGTPERAHEKVIHS